MTIDASRFLLLLPLLLVGCRDDGAGRDSDLTRAAFAGVQERGRDVMGIDQYTSTHRFDTLTDGGRIELQRDVEDPEGVATIRAHLRELGIHFALGDFTAPGRVHDRLVPGTEVMARKRGTITYAFAELPRGAELRITTDDPQAIEAVHAFIEFQRSDHRAEGQMHGH